MNRCCCSYFANQQGECDGGLSDLENLRRFNRFHLFLRRFCDHIVDIQRLVRLALDWPHYSKERSKSTTAKPNARTWPIGRELRRAL